MSMVACAWGRRHAPPSGAVMPTSGACKAIKDLLHQSVFDPIGTAGASWTPGRREMSHLQWRQRGCCAPPGAPSACTCQTAQAGRPGPFPAPAHLCIATGRSSALGALRPCAATQPRSQSGLFEGHGSPGGACRRCRAAKHPAGRCAVPRARGGGCAEAQPLQASLAEWNCVRAGAAEKRETCRHGKGAGDDSRRSPPTLPAPVRTMPAATTTFIGRSSARCPSCRPQGLPRQTTWSPSLAVRLGAQPAGGGCG